MSDLFFENWLQEVSKLHDISKYDKDFMKECYRLGYTPKDFYDFYIYLPF